MILFFPYMISFIAQLNQRPCVKMLKSVYLVFSIGKQNYDMKIPQFLENKGADQACNLLLIHIQCIPERRKLTGTVLLKLTGQTNPLQILLKYTFSCCTWGGPQISIFLTKCFRLEGPSEVEEILKGLIKVRLQPQIPPTPKKSRAVFILACKLQKQ